MRTLLREDRECVVCHRHLSRSHRCSAFSVKSTVLRFQVSGVRCQELRSGAQCSVFSVQYSELLLVPQGGTSLTGRET